MDGADRQSNRSALSALFVLSGTTLLYEILLTRIFSVVMWYHYAFIAVSVALLGLTVGAILVFLFPKPFEPKQLRGSLAIFSALFGMSIMTTFILLIVIVNGLGGFNVNLTTLMMVFVLSSVPFVLSGVVIAAALTKLSLPVGKLYAADLLGAAAAAAGFGGLLFLVDGISAIFVVSSLGLLAAGLFSVRSSLPSKLRLACFGLAAVCLFFAAVHTPLARRGQAVFKFNVVKHVHEVETLHEDWNAFSRLRVWGDPSKLGLPVGWGFSKVYGVTPTARQLGLNIDGSAYTVMTHFDGDPTHYNYLGYDITNFAHHLRNDADVFVVGAGGGRDVLSGLVFNQRSITAAEINPDILRIVNERYGDFTGHLDRLPNVHFVNAEARSYLGLHEQDYDLIQVSLIDTWAATAAGAFALSENPLYTVEGWDTFLNKLKPGGLLSFTRWFDPDTPTDTYRLTELARTALERRGVQNPEDHIAIVRVSADYITDMGDTKGLATFMISRDPLTTADVSAISRTADQLKFTVDLLPGKATDPNVLSLTKLGGNPELQQQYTEIIDAPTDDRPFFFYPTRFEDELRQVGRELWSPVGLLVLMTATALVFMFAPLWLARRRMANVLTWRGSDRLLAVYFAAIGFGFILVELSQMQRLTVFLGHPTTALSVVLFVLLLASGLGSFVVGRIGDSGLKRLVRNWGWVFALALLAYAFVSPELYEAFRLSEDIIRMAVSSASLAVIGFLMGFAFPLGMRMIPADRQALSPWLWGVNGVTSVTGSVLAVVISLHAGITASFWTGVGAYVIALTAIMLLQKKRPLTS